MTPAADTPVIGYARVSSEEQGISGAGLDAQEAAIRAECERRGWTLTAMHREVGSGRTTARRPLLAHAIEQLEDASPGSPQALVVAKLDRLTRSVADGARLFERSTRNGWGIVAIDLGVDTTQAAGRLVANVMVAVGEWERMVISERTKAGLAAKKAQGVKIGRPRAMPEATLARLRELRGQGMSLRKIADTLNDEGIAGPHGGRWHNPTVHHALRRYGLAP